MEQQEKADESVTRQEGEGALAGWSRSSCSAVDGMEAAAAAYDDGDDSDEFK